MFQKFDRLFISLVEKRCHSLQRLTGKTNYWFAGACSFLIAFILVGAFFGFFSEEIAGKDTLILSMAYKTPALFWILVVINILASQLWRKAETQAYTRLSRGCANPQKISPTHRCFRFVSFLNLSVFFLPSVSIFGVCDKIILLLFFIGIFLSACDPLPPKLAASKIFSAA